MPFDLSPLVETVGLEPTTFCLQNRCSRQVSYIPLVPEVGFEPTKKLIPQGLSLLRLPFRHSGIWSRRGDSNPYPYYGKVGCCRLRHNDLLAALPVKDRLLCH